VTVEHDPWISLERNFLAVIWVLRLAP
jgi:hypothetical protein